MEEKIANLERAKKESWEEKQKLSAAFAEEREKNLKNENYVRNVMQTVKQENVDLIKRLKALQREKNELTTTFKSKKLEYSGMKKSLEKDMLQYSTLMKEGAESGTTDEDALAHLLSEIEMKRQNLLNDREELKRIQRDLAENDERQTEERAEMAAQKTLIQQDKQLRSQIAEEERKKFMEEKQSYLDEVLTKERTRLQAQAQLEVEELKKSFRRGTGNVENQKKMFFWRCQCLEDKQLSSLIIAVIIVDR